MSPLCENIIRGAGSVTFFPNNNYQLILKQYLRSARRLGTQLDEYSIKQIAFERFIGLVLFTGICSSAIILSILLIDINPIFSGFSAFMPVSLGLAVTYINHKLDCSEY